MMNILHINRDKSGGASIAASRLNHALNSHNKIFSRILFNEDLIENNFLLFFYFKFRTLFARVLSFCNRRKNPIFHSLNIFPSLLHKKINNINADLINLHWISGEMISYWDISRLNKPVVWTLHDSWLLCGAEHIPNNNNFLSGYKNNNFINLNKIIWNAKRLIITKNIYLVAPSSWLFKLLKKSSLTKYFNISHIPNPIDTSIWKPFSKRISRSFFKIDKEDFVIGFGTHGSNYEMHKGFDLLLQAMEKFPRNKKITFLIFGSSNANLNFKNPKIKIKIKIIPMLTNVRTLVRLYSTLDLLCVPSRVDNFPNVGIEAHACGIPVVAFNIGGLSDIVSHKTTGYLAKPFDVSDFYQGINWVLKKSKKNSELSLNCRKKAKSLWSYSKVSKSYTLLYKDILHE